MQTEKPLSLTLGIAAQLGLGASLSMPCFHALCSVAVPPACGSPRRTYSTRLPPAWPELDGWRHCWPAMVQQVSHGSNHRWRHCWPAMVQQVSHGSNQASCIESILSELWQMAVLLPQLTSVQQGNNIQWSESTQLQIKRLMP